MLMNTHMSEIQANNSAPTDGVVARVYRRSQLRTSVNQYFKTVGCRSQDVDTTITLLHKIRPETPSGHVRSSPRRKKTVLYARAT